MHGKPHVGISDLAATNHTNFKGFHDFVDGCPSILAVFHVIANAFIAAADY
jgi:hypothetical protein